MKMSIAPAFKKWLRQASLEDKKKLCSDGNALSASLRSRKKK